MDVDDLTALRFRADKQNTQITQTGGDVKHVVFLVFVKFSEFHVEWEVVLAQLSPFWGRNIPVSDHPDGVVSWRDDIEQMALHNASQRNIQRLVRFGQHVTFFTVTIVID